MLGLGNLTLIRVFQPQKQSEDRAFTGAVGADNADAFSRVHLEGAINKEVLFCKGFAYVEERNHIFSYQLPAISLQLLGVLMNFRRAGLHTGQLKNPPVSPVTKGGYFTEAGFNPARLYMFAEQNP